MKSKYLFIVLILLFIVLQNVPCQNPLVEILSGTWYCSDNTPFQYADTLVFYKDFEGISFNMWEFGVKNQLKISSGSIRENNKNAKCFNRVLHYTWQIRTVPDNFSILQISFGKTLINFTIYSANNSKLVLVKHFETH